MAGATYEDRRGEVETYFDRTAADAWKRLTSDAPVGRIRATVRAGRDTMRGDSAGLAARRPDRAALLDAGCGTGALSVEAARRGAEVVAIDLSPTLVELARERLPTTLGEGSIDFRVGDMLDPALGTFDHVVSMDSLIHYEGPDAVKVLALDGAADPGVDRLHLRPAHAAPGDHACGGQAVPALRPLAGHRAAGPAPLYQTHQRRHRAAGWTVGRTKRVANGFYISQALELVAP